MPTPAASVLRGQRKPACPLAIGACLIGSVLVGSFPAALAQTNDPSGAPLQIAPVAPASPAPIVSPAASGGAASPAGDIQPAPWTERQLSTGADRSCLIEKTNGGYHIAVTASSATPGTVTFELSRAAWSLIQSQGVPVQFTFDDGQVVPATAAQDPNGLRVGFDATTLRPWMHEFTRAGLMNVISDSKAFAAVPISLKGTTPAITAMSDCIKMTGLQDVPPPFETVPVAAGSPPITATSAAPADDIMACASIASDLQRLACYDSHARPVASGQLVPGGPIAPAPASIPAVEATVATPPSSEAGLDEARFLAIVDQGSASYDQGSNEMAKGASRPARAKALCELGGYGVRDWKGTIETLSSNNSGKGVLEIRLGPHVTVGTTNNDFSDSISDLHTLIDPGSPVFAAATALKVGDPVIFSGRFGPTEDDCFAEQSVTQEGSMHDPEFLFAFSSVAAAPPR